MIREIFNRLNFGSYDTNKAIEYKNRVKRSIDYQNQEIDMSDACLSIVDRQELYSYFVEKKVKKQKLITRIDDFDDIRIMLNTGVDECFEDIGTVYSGVFKFYRVALVDSIEKWSSRLYFFHYVTAPLSYVFLFSLLFEMAKLFGFCMHVDMVFDSEQFKEKIGSNLSKAQELVDGICTNKSPMSLFYLPELWLLALVDVVDMSIVGLRKLTPDFISIFLRSISAIEESIIYLKNNVQSVYNGKITPNSKNSSQELADEIVKFYNNKLKNSDLPYKEVISEFGKKLAKLDLTKVNFKATHLILKTENSSFKGLKNIFSDDFILFYEMLRSQNLQNFKNLMGDQEFSQAVWLSSQLNGAIAGLLEAKNIDVKMNQGAKLSLENVDYNFKMSDLKNKQTPLTKKEMRAMLAKIILFRGQDFEEMLTPQAPEKNAKNHWRKFIGDCVNENDLELSM